MFSRNDRRFCYTSILAQFLWWCSVDCPCFILFDCFEFHLYLVFRFNLFDLVGSLLLSSEAFLLLFVIGSLLMFSCFSLSSFMFLVLFKINGRSNVQFLLGWELVCNLLLFLGSGWYVSVPSSSAASTFWYNDLRNSVPSGFCSLSVFPANGAV